MLLEIQDVLNNEKLSEEEKVLKIKELSVDSYGLSYKHIPEIFENKNIIDFYKENKISLIINEELSIYSDSDITHSLIEGENYLALCALRDSGYKADVIYIDPPYNTGSNDFLYNDKYVEKDDPDHHSRWLSFMDKRIAVAKGLLDKDGCLIASIGEDELHNLSLLLEKHFKFVSEPIIWQSKTSGNNNKSNRITTVSTEFVIIAYNNKNFRTNPEIHHLDDEKNEFAINKKERYKKGIFLDKELSEYEDMFIDGKRCKIIPKGEFHIGNFEDNSFKGHRFQQRTAQKGHGSWGYKVTYDKACERGVSETDDFLMAIMDVKDKQGLGIKFQYGNKYFQSISNEIKAVMPNFLGYYQGGYKGFQTAKPVKLIKRLLRNTTSENAKVLDFFAGSGTSLVALEELNIEDGGNREITIITNNDGNICSDFTYPRVKKSIKDSNLLFKKVMSN